MDSLSVLTLVIGMIPVCFFLFIFIEWSGRHKGEGDLHTRLFGERLHHGRQKEALGRLVNKERNE